MSGAARVLLLPLFSPRCAMALSNDNEDIVARVKAETDIVRLIGEHVVLRKSGANFMGLCPFHGEKTPSFYVYPGTASFYCFGCGKSGDVIEFVKEYNHVDFPAALKDLAARCHIALPEKKLSERERRQREMQEAMFRLNGKVADIFRKHLASPAATAARNYLDKRGIGEAMRQRFALGCAPSGWNFLDKHLSTEERKLAVSLGLIVKKEDGGGYDRFRDRIIFPIFNGKGHVSGFGGRAIQGDGKPKYLNSPESAIFSKSHLLLGFFQQRQAIGKARRAVVVEGNFDLVSLVGHGCEEVAAPLGTALTKEQLRLLKPLAEEIILLFDGDEAGLKAAMRAAPLFLAEEMTGRVALLPAGHDPDSFVRENGLAAVRELLGQAAPLPEFFLEQLIARHGQSLDGKRLIVGELKTLVAAASPLYRRLVISHFAGRLGIDAQTIEERCPPEMSSRREMRQEPPPDFVTAPMPHEPAGQAVSPPQRVPALLPEERRLASFMLLHPWSFTTLIDAGIRDCLGDGGRILCRALENLLRERPEATAEDLLAILPPGAERAMAVEIFAEDGGRFLGDPQGELDDILLWLRRYRLRETSRRLLAEIRKAREDGNQPLVRELLQQKQEADRELSSGD
ncbi:MAG TPA: DNA primase [Desulfobulbaceae bacterium]|nr:DNA primase [Desulfobulbaceae bacterium]